VLVTKTNFLDAKNELNLIKQNKIEEKITKTVSETEKNKDFDHLTNNKNCRII
jgi:hypothetical protein